MRSTDIQMKISTFVVVAVAIAADEELNVVSFRFIFNCFVFFLSILCEHLSIAFFFNISWILLLMHTSNHTNNIYTFQSIHKYFCFTQIALPYPPIWLLPSNRQRKRRRWQRSDKKFFKIRVLIASMLSKLQLYAHKLTHTSALALKHICNVHFRQ